MMFKRHYIRLSCKCLFSPKLFTRRTEIGTRVKKKITTEKQRQSHFFMINEIVLKLTLIRIIYHTYRVL